MIRYGILGFGNHGVSRLVPAFAGAKESVLTGIWRRDTHSQAGEFGIEYAFASAADMCTSQAIDAVLVSSPDALHMNDTLLAVSHGKPVLCEKPAMNAKQVERMLAGARKANVLFRIAQNFRYSRSVNLVRDWLRRGRIGLPIFATANFRFQVENSPRKWIYDPSLACGGPIGDVGIRCIDALRYVLADNVSAVATMAFSTAPSESVKTDATLTIEFARGTLGEAESFTELF